MGLCVYSENRALRFEDRQATTRWIRLFMIMSPYSFRHWTNLDCSTTLYEPLNRADEIIQVDLYQTESTRLLFRSF